MSRSLVVTKMATGRPMLRVCSLTRPLREADSSSWGLLRFRSTTAASLESDPRPFSEIPGVRVLPGLGTSWQYLKWLGGPYDKDDLVKVQLDKYRKYGKVVRDRAGSMDIVHLFDPADVKNMLGHEGKYPVKGTIVDIVRAYNKRENIVDTLIHDGEEWYDDRIKVQVPMLKLNTVRKYLDMQEHVAQDFIARMRKQMDENNEVQNFDKELNRFAAEAIAVVVYGKRLNTFNSALDEEVEKFTGALEGVFEVLGRALFKFPWYRYFKTPLYREFANNYTYIRKVGRKYLEECRAQIKQQQQSKTSEDSEHRFLMSLLKRDDLTDEQLLATCTGLFFAGVDSTAKSSAIVLYNLAKNPDKLQTLVEEIDRVIPNNAPVTQQAVDTMSYLKACVKESFRMSFPASFGPSRRLDHEVVMSGYRIPPGVLMMTNSAVMCRMEDYFPQPDAFIPERWLRDNQESMRVDPNISSWIHLPFGHGPRSCLGRRFAEQELYLLVSKVLQNFKLEYNHHDLHAVNKGVFTGLVESPRFKFTNR